ncbi:COQ3.2 family protein [Megaselia abdita]
MMSRTEKENGIEHFNKWLGSFWWPEDRPNGLQLMNKVRVPFIKEAILSNENRGQNDNLQGIKILDAGCGGGILAEDLARTGAQIVGIDMAEEVIKEAQTHLKLKSKELESSLTYKLESIESHQEKNNGKYDAVVSSEVIEHIDVNEVEDFVKSCVEAVKPGGAVIITTVNKTFCAWWNLVVGAEYWSKRIPKGTHFYNRMVPAQTLIGYLEKAGCTIKYSKGFAFDFNVTRCDWSDNLDYFYAVFAVKNK